MAQTSIPANNRGLISTFGQYYNRTSNSFSGIFGTATYPQRALSNLNIDYYGTSTLLYVNIGSSNATRGSVSITSPWSETSSGTELIGNDRQALSSVYGYIGITANTNYPYVWNGWYTLPSGGSLITTSQGTSVGVGSHSGVWYAVWD